MLICDKRPHIGGNAYDHYDEDGVLVHKYGPHIFHTNSRRCFDYLSRFTEWRPYQHRVRACVDGQLVPIPINLDTVNQLYGTHFTSFELEDFFQSVAEPRHPIKTSEDVIVSQVGRELYEKFFRNYTRKQWGLDPSELDAERHGARAGAHQPRRSLLHRHLPGDAAARLHADVRADARPSEYQVLLNADYREIRELVPHRQLIYTGPVDEYFDYRFGKLPYRSLRFQFETRDVPVAQPAPVINYPNEHLYTRVTEFKYLTGQEHPKTTLVYEFPTDQGDPYYPVPDRRERSALCKVPGSWPNTTPEVHFLGRLATYKYYNMDQVVAQALAVYAKLAGQPRREIATAPVAVAVKAPRRG